MIIKCKDEKTYIDIDLYNLRKSKLSSDRTYLIRIINTIFFRILRREGRDTYLKFSPNSERFFTEFSGGKRYIHYKR